MISTEGQWECHPMTEEGSGSEILHFVQNDNIGKIFVQFRGFRGYFNTTAWAQKFVKFKQLEIESFLCFSDYFRVFPW